MAMTLRASDPIHHEGAAAANNCRAEKTMTTETYEVRNRWTNEVQFAAQIEGTPDMTPAVKLGLAVRWGRQNNADLSHANLNGADLRGADLSHANLSDANLRGADLRDAYLNGANLSHAYLNGANLSHANLSDANLSDANLSHAYLNGANLNGADLRGANLSDANLRSFIADLWMILSMARLEVPALVAALRNGQVDGWTYSGDCACLVGTLENAGAVNIPHEASSPAEQWFAMIRKGDKPGDDSGGGFAAGKALEWTLDYCARTGLELPEAA